MMGDSEDPAQSSTSDAVKQWSDFKAVLAEVENSTRIAALTKTLDDNVDKSDPAYAYCVDRIKSGPTHPDLGEEHDASTPANVWNTIIVNQTPPIIDGVPVNRERFLDIFSEYGTIKHAYLCESEKPSKPEKLARITYTNEKDARKVMDASEKKMLRYNDHVLAVTLASRDYSPIQNLTDDCLHQIFLHISSVQDKFNVELVCKLWNSIGRECWSSVSKVTGDWKSHVWKTIISRASESIRDVQLRVMDEIEDGNEEAKDAKRSLSLIAEHLTRLERLAVSVFLDDPLVITPTFRTIISKNKSLRRLCLWRVDLDEGFIDSLSDEMTEIQINSSDPRASIASGPVNFSRFRNLQVLGLFTFRINKDQLKGIESLENLRVLKLKESYVHPSNIQEIANLTKLEHLSITNSPIPDVVLTKILKNNRGLKHLDISDAKEVTDLSFQHISKLPHLQVLLMENLGKVTDKYFIAIPSLTKLNCNGCRLITDVGVQRLFTPDSVLKTLYIADCSITLESLKAASNWAPPERRSILILVNRKMEQEWKNSGLKKPLTEDRTWVAVARYEGNDPFLIHDPVEDDCMEIFDWSA